MWTYSQSTGKLSYNLELCGIGYSGKAECKNNPEYQDVHNRGPIPRGIYEIQGPVDTKEHGPFVLWLKPNMNNQMFGRSGFGIHGDSIIHSGEASDGCIILNHETREKIWLSGDKLLEVIE